MSRRPKVHGEGGFTLVETLAAMTIFAIITLGIVPLLASAIRGTALARSSTVAENAARDAMERIRGTRWFISYDAKPNKRVDILDLYYPQANNTGLFTGQSYSSTGTNLPVTGAGGVFTTTCPSVGNPACPASLPAGHTLTITASFVEPITTTTPQTYQMKTPVADYAWNVQGKDSPPSQLMDITTTMSWTIAGDPKSYALRSIIGDRKFIPQAAVDAGPSPSPSSTPPQNSGVLKLRGRADLDYLIQVQTGFQSTSAGTGCPAQPCYSELTSTAGISHASIETQDVSVADVETQSFDNRIVRTYPSPQVPPDTPPADLANVPGAVSRGHAPPIYNCVNTCAQVPVATTTASINHTDGGITNPVALIYRSNTNNMKADVTGELPKAEGNFKTTNPTAGLDELYVHNSQADFSTNGFLRLDTTTNRILRVRSGYSASSPNDLVQGFTKAITTALGAGRSVQSLVHGEFWQLSMLKVNFSTKPWILNFLDFQADVNCISTANPANDSATATWSGRLTYSYDSTNNNNVSLTSGTAIMSGSYFTSDTLNGVAVTNALASLQQQNPLIYDGNTAANDIYLFDDPAAAKKGYLKSWTANKDLITTATGTGRETGASIDSAIRIDTNQLHATNAETAYNVSIAKMSCESVDNR